MNDNCSTIFLVDDDPASRLIIADEFERGNYQVREFEHGEDCLNVLESGAEIPDLILMDVEMPVLGGYDTCRKIREQDALNHIEIIFISSHNTTEEKLKGYDAGGNDYLIKPVQPEELHRKVALAIKNKSALSAAAAQNSFATQAAMTAMNNASELGLILDFTRRSFNINRVADLAQLIIEAFTSFGLDTSVQIRATGETVHAGTSAMSPLEQELLTRLKDAGRILQRQKRVIANFGAISLLVKNMPEEDDKQGRIRDHLAILLESAEARLQSLELHSQLAQLIVDSRHSLDDIESRQREQKASAMQIMDDVMGELETSFLSYGLTENQETILLQIVKNGVDRTMANFEKGLKIDAQMRDIIDRLEHFTMKLGAGQ